LDNGYKSTWPNFKPNSGGPATAWPVQDGWDGEHEYRYLTFAVSEPGEVAETFREVQRLRCKWSNEVWENRDVTAPDQSVEIDKLVGTVRTKGGVYHGMAFQTPPNKFVATRGTVFSNGGLNGGARKTLLDGISSFAPFDFGAAEDVVVLNSTITGISVGGLSEADVVGAGYSMSGGTIKINKAARAARIGTAIQWANQGRKVLYTSLCLTAVNSMVIGDISVSGRT
jgi:hypothetical protein